MNINFCLRINKINQEISDGKINRDEYLSIKKELINILENSNLELEKIEVLKILYLLNTKRIITSSTYRSILEDLYVELTIESTDAYFINFLIKFVFLEKIFSDSSDFLNEPDKFEKIKNKDVQSTYYYYYGLYKLYTINSDNIIPELIEIQKSFKFSFEMIENRLDSKFYYYLLNFLLEFMKKSKCLNCYYNKTQECLQELILNSYKEDRNFKINLLGKMDNILKLNEKIATEEIWLNYETEIFSITYLLNDFFIEKEVLNEDIFKFDNLISKNVLKKLVVNRFYSDFKKLLPKISYLKNKTTNLLVRNVLEKLEFEIKTEDFDLNIKKWNPLMVQILKLIDTKDINSIYENKINKIINLKKLTDFEKFMEIISIMEEIFSLKTGYKTGYRKGEKIYNNLMNSLQKKLNLEDKCERKKLYYFSDLIIKIINYMFLISTSPKESFKLYYSDCDTNKKESDFQGNIFNELKKTNIASYLTLESNNTADGGRVDILYKNEDICIPIEIKTNKTRNLDKTRIENDYIAQAQTYVYPYNELGIFIVFDLSSKDKSYIPNDMQDLINIHSLNPHLDKLKKIPNHIISFIIPANRILPSSKSKYS